MKTVIEMAREAGICFGEVLGVQRIIDGWLPDLERFAALVREDEREACAKACEDLHEKHRHPILIDCIAAIRARGTE